MKVDELEEEEHEEDVSVENDTNSNVSGRASVTRSVKALSLHNLIARTMQPDMATEQTYQLLDKNPHGPELKGKHYFVIKSFDIKFYDKDCKMI